LIIGLLLTNIMSQIGAKLQPFKLKDSILNKNFKEKKKTMTPER